MYPQHRIPGIGGTYIAMPQGDNTLRIFANYRHIEEFIDISAADCA